VNTEPKPSSASPSVAATGSLLRYVLVTPARNEVTFIEQTIKAVVAQTFRPLKWAIVSDGSTDGTDEIVQRYAAEHPWIELVRMPERKERHFAGKILAFNAGYDCVRKTSYDVVASLDADITFDVDYFSFLLGKLAASPELGLVGTPFEDQGVSYDYRFVSIEHVSGACQVFRRECFEAIGGYIPMKGGGVDHVAVLSCRMKGWKTRTFTEKKCVHHRVMGTAKHSGLASKYNIGKLDYALGGHPLWELFRGVYQMTKKPFLTGGCAILAGYFGSLLSGAKRPISDELVRFRRGEQMVRLKKFLLRQQSVANAGGTAGH
jgi:poly-beta-1,6-N-acetyl-D-glucosamine synthase